MGDVTGGFWVEGLIRQTLPGGIGWFLLLRIATRSFTLQDILYGYIIAYR